MSPRSYHSPVRQAAASETRARIIAAAGSLLRGVEGAAGFSLEAVAKKAGVTRLTVYKQFGSRRALLEEVFDELAASRGFYVLAEVMNDADPFRALRRIVAFFCKVYGSDTPALLRLHSAGASDPELEESVRERNERRRCLLLALVRRMAPEQPPDGRKSKDLVDMLFALTSLHFFAQLSAGNRSTKAVCRLVQSSCEDALRRAGLDPDSRRPRRSQ